MPQQLDRYSIYNLLCVFLRKIRNTSYIIRDGLDQTVTRSVRMELSFLTVLVANVSVRLAIMETGASLSARIMAYVTLQVNSVSALINQVSHYYLLGRYYLLQSYNVL